MANIFNSIPLFRPRRNVFPSLMNENRLSTDFFRITPFAVEEAYADDVWRLRAELFSRVSPLASPVMHRFDFRVYWFFVPYRIVWDHYEDFFSGMTLSQADGPRLHDAAPKITFKNNGFAFAWLKTLSDYMDMKIGLDPTDMATFDALSLAKAAALHPDGLTVSQLPYRCYQQIINDYFIGASLAGPNEFDKGDDPLTISVSGSEEEGFDDEAAARELVKIRYKSWNQDYFTSALPRPQRGPDVNAFDGGSIDPESLSIQGTGSVAVNVPAYTNYSFAIPGLSVEYDSIAAAILANPSVFGFDNAAAAQYFVNQQGDALTRLPVESSGGFQSGDNNRFLTVNLESTPTPVTFTVRARTAGNLTGSSIASKLSISGDGEAAIPAVTVEELRTRMQLQQWCERENLANGAGKGRYKQSLYAHWGVTGGDGRLQRAEFIGGSKQPLMINEVSQLSAPTDDDPLGQLAGQGVSSSAGRGYRYRVPEHGMIIGLLCVTPRTAYMQGLRKFWKKFDRLDFYYPEFAHIGEEPIYYRELLNNGFNGDDVFGYNLRNADLKARVDTVHGDLAGNLAYWTAARAFKTPADATEVPKLSLPFLIPEDSAADDVDRIFPVQNSAFEQLNADHFVVDVINHTVASRLMPRHSTPRVG